MGKITLYNVGILERIVRVGFGFALILTTMSISAPSQFVILLPLLAIYPVLTGMFGWDPVYELLGKLIRAVDKRVAYLIERGLLKTSEN